jgi:hypothetical protein
MQRYRPIFQCVVCGTRWKAATVRSGDGRSPEEDAAYRLAMNGTPQCPNLDCGHVQQPIGMDLSLQKAPAAVGANLQVKAIDQTAKMVMQDYGMTDLRSDVRVGETAAPKLPPRQQVAADNFFAAGRARGPAAAAASRAAARAMAGMSRQPTGYEPVSALHNASPETRDRIRPPIRIVAGDRR